MFFLNQLQYIKTLSSCFGHGKKDIKIWFNSYNKQVLESIKYLVENYNNKWTIQIELEKDDVYPAILIGKNGLSEKDCNDLADFLFSHAEISLIY